MVVLAIIAVWLLTLVLIGGLCMAARAGDEAASALTLVDYDDAPALRSAAGAPGARAAAGIRARTALKPSAVRSAMHTARRLSNASAAR